MTKRGRMLGWCGLALGALASGAGLLWLRGALHRAAAGPDLVLVSIDTLRADRVGAYGYSPARTPTIDALAARGVRFDQATTPLPRTTPAIASLMSGLWPHRHGSREVRQPLESGETLAELLGRQGYRTLAVSSNGTIQPEQGIDRGFDTFVPSRSFQRPEGATPRAAQVTDAALRLVDEVGSGSAVFLWVHYVDPHFPYDPPPEFSAADAPSCRAFERGPRDRLGAVFADRGGVARQALAECSDLYDAEIAYTDREVGRLLEGLSARGRGQALVVLTSDHGENLGEDGLFYQHGPSLSDASLRVPLVIAGPGIAAGRVDERSVRLEDLAPTLLALLRVPADVWPATDGVDISTRLRAAGAAPAPPAPVAYAESGNALMIDFHPALVSGRPRAGYCLNAAIYSLCWGSAGPARLHQREEDPDRERDISAENPEEYARLLAARERWSEERPRQRCARDGRYKLVERPRLEGGYTRALYDLARDPGETSDVAAAHPQELVRLGRLLDAWTAELPGFEARELSEEDEAALRALGYVD